MKAHNVRLITVIGSFVRTLPQMLDHYQALGVTSFLVHLHLPRNGGSDLMRSEVEDVVSSRGIRIASVQTGEWVPTLRRVFNSELAANPNDWHVMADQDEFQVYPEDFLSVLSHCDDHGYNYVRGCFIDRLAADGTFPILNPSLPLWDQYPIGAFLTLPLLGCDPRKVVAAKGCVQLLGSGRHGARGIACPTEQYLVQVHHFKWISGIVEETRRRARMFIALKDPRSIECTRLLEYLATHSNRIDLTDGRFLSSPTKPEYSNWEAVRSVLRHHYNWL